MSKIRFLLDANVLITAHRRYYAFDIVPSFWRRIAEAAANGEWAIIDRVADEIIPKGDPLAKWLENEYPGEILPSNTPRIFSSYSLLMTSCQEDETYRESARSEFADCADSWLVAHGMASKSIIVSFEKEEKSKRKIKIPNICADHNVKCIDTYDFLRQLRIRI